MHLGEIAQLITAIAVAYNIWQTWRVRKRSRTILSEVEVLKEQTNGLGAKLLKATGESEFARGVKEGGEH